MARLIHLRFCNVNPRPFSQVLRFGFSRSLGPMSLMGGGGEQSFLGKSRALPVAEMSFDLARRAEEEIFELVRRAEARAFVGLQTQRKLLEKVTDVLLEKRSLTGRELQALVEVRRNFFHTLLPFPDLFPLFTWVY